MLTHADVWRAIDQLAAKHGLSASGLARRAGLDPTTFNKSKRTTREGKQRWPSTESIAKILAATGETLGDFVVLVGGNEASALKQRMPVLVLSQAERDEHFDGVDRRAIDRWDEISFPQELAADCFALEISDDRFAPVYREGDVLILSPGAVLRRGDRIVIKLRSGEIVAGRFVHQGLHRVEFTPIASEGPNREFESDQVAWIARVLWASQ